MELRKCAIRTPTFSDGRKATGCRDVSASPGTVLRSRRPQTRLDTFCTRTGRARRHRPAYIAGRSAGEGDGRTARLDAFEESDRGTVPMNHWNKEGKPLAENEEGRPRIKENTRWPNTPPTQSGARVSQGRAGVRKAAGGIPAVRRHTSEIRAVCANQRTYGSVRGVPGNRYPYRDRQPARSAHLNRTRTTIIV
jgi:hypothetical protein